MKFFLCLLAAVCSLCLFILFCSVGVCFLSGFGPMTSWLRKTRLRQTPRSDKSESALFQNVTPSANSDQSESALFSKCHPQCQLRPVRVGTVFKISPPALQNVTLSANSDPSESALFSKFHPLCQLQSV